MTSSTECFRTDDSCKENSENSMQQLDQPYCDAVEKVCSKFSSVKRYYPLFSDAKKTGKHSRKKRLN